MSNTHSNQNQSPQGSQKSGKKTWDDSASNYAAHLEATTSLKPMYNKAGITDDDVIFVASQMLYKIGIDIEDSDLRKGGTFDKELSVHHAKKDKWISGRTSQKGFVKFHGDEYPYIYGLNWTTGEEIKGTITLDDIADNLPSFSKSMINEKGWLKPEHVPASFANKPPPPIDYEARERDRAAKMVKQEQDNSKREQVEKKALVTISATHQKALDAHAKAALVDNTIEPHANHLYVQKKYGDDLPHYNPYLKNLVASAITFTSKKDDKVYPLLQAGYDIKTGQMTAMQRTMHASTQIKGVNGAKDTYEPIFKEDGTPEIVKKFAPSTNANNSATPIHNLPSPNIKTYYLAEGMSTGATWAAAKDIKNSEDADTTSILSVYNAANIVNIAADIREVDANARIVIIADDDYQTELNAGQKYAHMAAEESDAIVVSAPREYLKDGQSDWDDIAKNITEALTQVEIDKTGDPNAKSGFEDMRQMLNSIMVMEELKATNAYNQRAGEVIEQAAHVVEERNKSTIPEALLEDKGKVMLLAVQDPNFKKLAIAVLNTAPLLEHSAEWTMPTALASILDNVELDDSALKTLSGGERKQLLRSASGTLVELLTDNKSHSALGTDNKSTLQELSADGWKVDDRYIKAFMKTLDENVVEGKQAAVLPEPDHLIDFSQNLVEFYDNQQNQSAQVSQSTQPAAAPVEPATAPPPAAPIVEGTPAAPAPKPNRPRP